MSFTQWLQRQRHRNDPIGDIARDAGQDETWPKRQRTFGAFYAYLEECGACDGALRALRAAWAEWRRAS